MTLKLMLECNIKFKNKLEYSYILFIYLFMAFTFNR